MKKFAIYFLPFLICFFSACSVGNQGKVVAIVNGEPIHERDLMQGMPKDSFSANLTGMKIIKLDRLIGTMLTRQFLRKNRVSVDEKDVTADLEDLKINPPSAGCMCCRYKSLQQYMEVNAYTMKEMRAEISNNLGLDAFVNKEWEQKYPTPESRSSLIRSERDRVLKSYVRLWHVFFNTFQNTNGSGNIMVEKQKEAQAAWARLNNGEGFETVARLVSNDAISRPKGGLLGCISRDTFGDVIKENVRRLKPGGYSGPLESIWGYHIIRWTPMTDTDILEVLKKEYMDVRRQQLYDQIFDKAAVKRMDEM